jgi:hypothetical protein
MSSFAAVGRVGWTSDQPDRLTTVLTTPVLTR